MLKILKNLGFLAFVATNIAVSYYYGPIAYTRLFGIFFVGASLSCIFVREVPVGFRGGPEVLRLKGWAKLFAIVPTLILGYCLIAYAPEITCSSYKYKHLCAKQ